MSEDRLKIAVFIDFDNIEIGVKSTLGAYFDIGSVLEAIKERGEVVTKIAYGDWTRAGDYGRSLSQHAVHMVQRNLTPGGDKNGADINLALDALEMAFTHSHINSFVIVSGDSDFISLVEKLKQYDRKVFVVGGRAFTSQVMQKNCTEFIAYENIVGRGRGADRSSRSSVTVTESPLSQAMPLVRRALKLLTDREVLPQLGLLKSTLLQLDSAFSEREYGAGSFRDFVQKLAKAGYVNLKGSERSFHVELREGSDAGSTAASAVSAPASTTAAPAATPVNGSATPEPAVAEAPAADGSMPPARLGPADVVRVVQQAVASATTPRWPLYIRQLKQLIRTVDSQFDERRYGFGSIVEALRHCQREGVLRLERDRQGIVRVWPAGHVPARGAAAEPRETTADAMAHDGEPTHALDQGGSSHGDDQHPHDEADSSESMPYTPGEPVDEPSHEPVFSFEQADSVEPERRADVMEGVFIEPDDEESAADNIGNRLEPEPAGARGTRKRTSRSRGPRTPRAAAAAGTGSGTRKTTGSRAPRTRKPKE